MSDLISKFYEFIGRINISKTNFCTQYFGSHLRTVIAKVPYKVAFEPARKCGSNERLLDMVALTVQK